MVAATVGVLFAFEGMIRAFRVIPDTIPIRYREIPGEEGFAAVPGSRGESLFGISHEVDGLGLRGPDRPLAKAAGMLRIAVVGDSVTWGYGVPFEATFGARLEERLRATGRDAEVWNLGLQATNVLNHRARYARLAPRIRPGVTIVVVLYNDLQARAERLRITSVGTLANPRREAPFPDSWRPVLERFAVYHTALRVWGTWEGHGAEYGLENFVALERGLDGIVEIAHTLGSTVIVALASGRYPPADRYDALASRLRSHCAARNVGFLALGDVLGNPGNPDLFLPGDPVHPNAPGHERIAQALAREIRG